LFSFFSLNYQTTMKTKQILQNLRNYIELNRRVGHTTAMMRGAQNVDDVLVLAANQNQAAMLQRELPRAEVVAITNPVCMIGKSKAMVMDNHALWEICGGALAEIERLETRIAELS
jgi:hypothetical protein